MGLLAEFLFEVVFQFLFELAGHLLGEGVTRTLRSRVGRLVVSAGVGFGGGYVWGAYLAGHGHTGTPRTVWISAAFAVAGLMGSFALRRAGMPGEGDGVRLLPWRWPPHQWEAFALLNVFVAFGVLTGFGGGATP